MRARPPPPAEDGPGRHLLLDVVVQVASVTRALQAADLAMDLREPGQVVGLAGGVTSSQAAASAAFRAARRRFAAYRSGCTEFSSNASSGPASAQDVVAGCVTDGRVLAAAHAWWPDEVAGAGL